MIFNRGPKRDYWAWREGFAWRPMIVNRRWIFWEPYRWRHALLPRKEWPMPFEVEWAEDFILSDGYSARKITRGSIGLPITSKTWTSIPADLKLAA